MVNVAGRSRGCAICRSRKTKCDLKLPECTKCVKAGIRCPGPRTGAFFIHCQAEAPTTGRSAIVQPSSSSPGISFNNRNPLHLPDTAQLQRCRASAFDQLMLTHFIESFGPISVSVPGLKMETWLDVLPQFLNYAEPTPAADAIRAASMISYGNLSQDAPIQKEAFRWYTKALQDLRLKLLQRGLSVIDANVCSTVMLMHFETWATTFPRSWLQHVKGACQMLESIGPEACQSGFLHLLFAHLRLQVFVAAMAENDLPVFASSKWMTVPYSNRTKTLFDELVDILFHTQRCLTVATSMIISKDAQRAGLRAELTTLVNNTAMSLDLWKCNYMATGWVDGIVRKSASCMYKMNVDPVFTDVPTAALAAFYYASRIISLRLLSLTTKSSDEARIEKQTRRILMASEFVQSMSSQSTGFGPIMMALQVRIASQFGSPSSLRDQALVVLRDGVNVKNGAYTDIATSQNGYFREVAAFTRAESADEAS